MSGKSFVLATLASGAAAQWWGGAPSCAQSCISSQYSAISATSAWPSPSAFCSAGGLGSVSSCLSSACSATPTAVASYSSMASSLCERWSSCSSAGSTGVYTVSWPGATATPTTTPGPAKTKRAGPGGGGGGGPGAGGPGEGPGGEGGEGFGPGFGGGWGSTFTGPSMTVTGCAWGGSPWMGEAGGDGWGGWGDWGAGWTWATHTATVTVTTTRGDGSVVLSTGLAEVAEAVSGSVTSTTTLTGAATGTAAASGLSSAGARGSDLETGVVLAGVVLGAVVAVFGLL